MRKGLARLRHGFGDSRALVEDTASRLFYPHKSDLVQPSLAMLHAERFQWFSETISGKGAIANPSAIIL